MQSEHVVRIKLDPYCVVDPKGGDFNWFCYRAASVPPQMRCSFVLSAMRKGGKKIAVFALFAGGRVFSRGAVVIRCAIQMKLAQQCGEIKLRTIYTEKKSWMKHIYVCVYSK